MEFGRLPSVDGLDLALPPDDAATARALGGAPREGQGVLVGTAGWSDRGFVGKLYPPGTRPPEFLAHYARVFPTNELNSTYYGFSRERIEKWAASVPDSFRFCPKLPAAISHERELRDADREMEAFVAALGGFGWKLGLVWFVLPPAFGPGRLPALAAFLERWAPRAPLAVELRHPAWFADAAARAEAFAVLEQHRVAPILTDVAGRRDVLHMRLATRAAFVRFVGNALHPSDRSRLDEWAARLAAWRAQGLETAYFFLHQKRDPQTVDLARHLAPRLAELTGTDPLPGLATAAEPPTPAQGELF